MLVLLFKNFIRSKGTKIGLLFLVFIGLISLLIGRQFQQKQQQNIVEATVYQKEHIARNAAFHKDEIGLLLYYVKFSLVNTTLPINSLAIGQRDVNPSIQSVTIRGLRLRNTIRNLIIRVIFYPEISILVLCFCICFRF